MCLATTPASTRCKSRLPACWVLRPRCSCRPGTQSNLCGVLAHCQRGDEYIVGQHGHTLPLGGRRRGGVWQRAAAAAGPTKPMARLALADIEAAIKPDDAHFARTRLLGAGEHLGGKVLPFDVCARRLPRLPNPKAWPATWMAPACSTPRWRRRAAPRARAPLQRGARALPNALTASRCALAKGWARPSGSALCGSKELIARAHRDPQDGRRRHAPSGRAGRGGQFHALDHHVVRGWPRTMHWRRRWRTGLRAWKAWWCRHPRPTLFSWIWKGPHGPRSAQLLDHLKSHGVLATGLYRVRMVTHLDVDAAGVAHAVAPKTQKPRDHKIKMV